MGKVIPDRKVTTKPAEPGTQFRLRVDFAWGQRVDSKPASREDTEALLVDIFKLGYWRVEEGISARVYNTAHIRTVDIVEVYKP